MQNFINQILKNLESNGFPEKKVSLPTEKMYEIADNKGFSLNTVLDKLAEDEGIEYEIGTEKIVFSKEVKTEFDASDFPNLNPDMMAKAQEMMSKMDPNELKAMQDKIQNMSEEERKKMMEQAKSMGLF